MAKGRSRRFVVNGGIEIRRATAGDNAAILQFMREHSMQAGLSLRFERAPDYFALHAAHSPTHVSWIAIDAGRIVAVASAVIRPGYIGGRIRQIAYIADLRQLPGRRFAGLWRRAADVVLNELRRDYAVNWAFFSILRENRLARASVLGSALTRKLGLRHLCAYATASVLALPPWPRPRVDGVRVRAATPRDDERLRAFIDAQSKKQLFAPVFDRTTWHCRINSWPDFGIEQFLLAVDDQQRIVGCLAPWDPARISRLIVDDLPPRADMLRRAANALARISRRPRIRTGPDTHLPVAMLTHVFIAERDPAIFRMLATAALRALFRSRRYALVTVCLYDDDPLWRGIRSTIRHSVPMDLYTLPLSSDAVALPLDAQWPGFEHYLV